MDNYLILMISKIKILMKMQKKMIKKKVELECNKFKKKMKKMKLKVGMLIFINLEELSFNFYQKVEMLIKVAWFVLNGVQLY